MLLRSKSKITRFRSWRSTASRRSRSRRATARVVLAPGGRADVFVDVAAPAGAAPAILLHDGNGGAPDRPAGRLEGAADPDRAAACRATAAVQRPAGAARSQKRAAGRSAARRTAGRLGDAGDLHAIDAARVPRQGRPHRGAGPDQPRRRPRPSSICTAIISGCWTGSTMAGSRSGWIRWRSRPARPSASLSPPNMPDAG